MSSARHVLVLCVLVCSLTLGCGEKHPQGMPDLVSCQITVTDGGTPMSKAVLSLSPVQGDWSAGGQTDANGVAVIRTRGFDGAAVGVYKVSIAKRADAEGPSDEAIAKMSYEEGTAAHAARREGASLVPDHLQIAKFSPVGVEVKTDGENNIALEIQDYPDPTREYVEMSSGSR